MKNIAAQSSRRSLMQIFDEETRMHPFACEISFNECESVMYKEEETNLKYPHCPRNFATYARIMIRTSQKFTLSLNDQTALILSTEHITYVSWQRLVIYNLIGNLYRANKILSIVDILVSMIYTLRHQYIVA